MQSSIRAKLLMAAAPLSPVVSPALANATTTPSGSRTGQTITRFYDQADRFTVRQGFDRIESRRTTLRPFYEDFVTESHNGTLGLPINEVEASI